MLNYIKGEIYRIFHSVSYYVSHALSLAYGLLMFVATYITLKFFKGTTLINFWSMISDLVNGISIDLLVILGIIFAMTVFGSDYKHGTMKNVIGMGISKTKVFFGKYIISLILVLSIYLSTILICGGLGAIVGGAGEFDKQVLLRFLLKCAYLALFTFMFCGIEHLIQSSGGTMAMAILTNVLAPTLVSIFSFFIKNKSVKKIFNVEWNSAVDLVLKKGFAFSNFVYLIISACIMVAIGVVCFVFYRKKDIK